MDQTLPTIPNPIPAIPKDLGHGSDPTHIPDPIPGIPRDIHGLGPTLTIPNPIPAIPREFHGLDPSQNFESHSNHSQGFRAWIRPLPKFPIAFQPLPRIPWIRPLPPNVPNPRAIPGFGALSTSLCGMFPQDFFPSGFHGLESPQHSKFHSSHSQEFHGSNPLSKFPIPFQPFPRIWGMNQIPPTFPIPGASMDWSLPNILNPIPSIPKDSRHGLEPLLHTPNPIPAIPRAIPGFGAVPLPLCRIFPRDLWLHTELST